MAKESVKLKNGTKVSFHEGRNVNTAPELLKKWDAGEGYIPSEADWIIARNANPQLYTTYADTSTLSATKGDSIKIILPYDMSGSHKLTDAARFGLNLINPSEDLIYGGVNLDKDGRWEKLEGNGVYTLKRKGLKLNEDLKEKVAMSHPIILTKLGHPDYVAPEFARTKEDVEKIISETFKIGKDEHGYDTMMGQYLSDVRDEGILKAWYAGSIDSGAWSNAGTGLDSDSGRFPLFSVGDARGIAARTQFQELEKILKPEQLNEIKERLSLADDLEGKVYLPQEQAIALGKGLVPDFAQEEFQKRVKEYYENKK